ncbi:hypothetical protein N7510_000542 [Penicillium lagena]|uniref:uncharacterized protein n=1 Tax=Penicillium lagena TaxID=94218 RepID=UPI00253FFA92|nr:uncharacterized protein N7510_000542 [Penicillium lagena]KAJ5624233.1 hypothetical protein N7510_000542 [Penicillium lagena]
MIVSLLLGAVAVAAVPTGSDSSSAIAVTKDAPQEAGDNILQPFVSFSIEFAFFPDYAGNKSHPNDFSNNLLDNLASLQGIKPYIRVGGNTQDFALYDPNLKTATNGTIVPAKSTDYPYLLSIGPSFFESYSTWPDTKFSHGFNLGKNGTAAVESLLATVPLACKALADGKLMHWELGNEPDLYIDGGAFSARPENWTESDYVTNWLTNERAIKQKMAHACPEMATDSAYTYLAPSFGGINNGLDPVKTWSDGLDSDKNIRLNSMHNYMGGATQPGVTLQKTLMNHTSVINSVDQHATLAKELQSDKLTPGIPYILGEMNSLYNEGAPGLSNSFGAALWGVDFNLYSASQSLHRAHMHQGTDYRYASWQPVQTNKTTKGTKAPYYGNAMVAAMLSADKNDQVRVLNLPLDQDTESAYAAYVNGNLARIAVVNMQEYNYTGSTAASRRPSAKYAFQLPEQVNGKTLAVQRLMANGSDAITGITWNGWSYNYELNNGKPVRLHNVTIGETVPVGKKGVVEIEVPWSSGAILDFQV